MAVEKKGIFEQGLMNDDRWQDIVAKAEKKPNDTESMKNLITEIQDKLGKNPGNASKVIVKTANRAFELIKEEVESKKIESIYALNDAIMRNPSIFEVITEKNKKSTD